MSETAAIQKPHSHRRKNSASGHVLGAGLLATAAGLIMFVTGTALLLRYSPYGDPRVGPPGALLFFGGAALAIIPAAIAAIRAGARCGRRYRAWKSSLGPGQLAAVQLAETAALAGAAAVLHEHGKATRARLTESVMGGPARD